VSGCITFSDAENAPIDLIAGVNRAFAMDAINAESQAVIGTIALSNNSTISTSTIPTGYVPCDGRSVDCVILDESYDTTVTGTGTFPAFTTWDREFAPDYRITGEVINVITA